VFYICLFDVNSVRVKKIQTCWSLSGLYVKVYILILVHLLVLPVKLFFKEQI